MKRFLILFLFLFLSKSTWGALNPGSPDSFSFSAGASAISSQAGISIAATSPTFSNLRGNKTRLSLALDEYFRSDFMMIKFYVLNSIYEVQDFKLYWKTGSFTVPRYNDSSLGISFAVKTEFPNQYFFYELGYYLPFWGTWFGQGLGGTLGVQVSF